MSLLSPAFNTGVYTITRTSGNGSTDASGHYTPPGTTTIPNVAASVQPLSGKALRDLKEGKRADDTRWVYTETPMFTVDEDHDYQDYIDIADEVTARMRRYRVTKVEYFGVISKHYRATVEKVNVP